MTQPTLLAKAYRLLDASQLTFREMAAGAGVGYEWLRKFKQRAIAEPGVTKIQGLVDFLSSHVEHSNGASLTAECESTTAETKTIGNSFTVSPSAHTLGKSPKRRMNGA